MQEMLQEKAAYRNIRMLEGTSKRAAKDAREVTTLSSLYMHWHQLVCR